MDRDTAYLVPIRQQTWRPQAILVFDWLISKKIFSSATAFPNEVKFGRNHISSVGSFGQAVSEEKIFKNWSIRNKNCL
jgi:hypothetical protein